jgi:SNF2 family DNA or RNA helicase
VYGISRPYAGILLDVGLGKTYVSINIARYWIQQGEAKKVLVVCPTSILTNWQNQIKQFSEYDSNILHNTNRKDRIHLIENSKSVFDLINYEGLQPYIKHLAKKQYDLIIFDESARYIKSPTAQRTKTSYTLARQAKFIYLLTGTIIENRPKDIWSQFWVMDDGKTFSSSYYAFLNYYFKKKKGYKYVIDPKTKKRVQRSWTTWEIEKGKFPIMRDRLFQNCIQKRKREVLTDLPEIIRREIPIPLEGKLREIYTKVQDQVLKEINTIIIENSNLKINNILTKLIRLQQITAGFIKNDKGEEVELSETPKLDALIEELESLVDAGDSAIVFCRFKKSISMIEDRLNKNKIKCITMTGEDKDKYSKWKGFQTSDVPVFVGQIKAGGIGIELFKIDGDSTKNQHMIYYEKDWVKGVEEQADGRIDRIGQKSTVIYTDIYIEKTIDTKILEVVKYNKKVSDVILNIKEGL